MSDYDYIDNLWLSLQEDTESQKEEEVTGSYPDIDLLWSNLRQTEKKEPVSNYEDIDTAYSNIVVPETFIQREAAATVLNPPEKEDYEEEHVRGLMQRIPNAGPYVQHETVSFIASAITNMLQGYRDFGHNWFPEISGKLSARDAVTSSVLPLLPRLLFSPINEETEQGKRMQAAQNVLINTGFGAALLGKGIDLKGDLTEHLGPKGERNLLRLFNDPSIHIDRTKLDSAIAEFGVDLAGWVAPYTGGIKLLNGSTLFGRVSNKIAGSKHIKRGPEGIETILKGIFAVPAATALSFNPYEHGVIANLLADVIDPNDGTTTKLVLDALSVNADDSVATAYAKQLVDDAVISAALLPLGMAGRSGWRRWKARKDKQMSEEEIIRFAAEVEARQLVRTDVPVVREVVDDSAVARIEANAKNPSKIIRPWFRKHFTPKGPQTEQMFSLFTGASNNEKNIARFMNREVDLLEEHITNVVLSFDNSSRTKAREVLWDRVQGVLRNDQELDVLPSMIQAPTKKIIDIVYGFTKEILDSPTIPADTWVRAEDGDKTIRNLVTDWASVNKVPLDEAVEQTRVINQLDSDTIKEGEQILMPGLRAVLNHNLGSYLRRSFEMHQVVPSLGQYTKRGIQTLLRVAPEDRTAIGYVPSSRIRQDAYDHLLNSEYEDFARFAGDSDDMLESLTERWPKVTSRMKTKHADELEEILDPEEQSIFLQQKVFDEVTNARINEILSTDTQGSNSLFNNAFLFGKSLSSTGRAIFTHRKDIPDPILALMGEIKDPRMTILDTVSKMAHWVEYDKALRKMEEIGGGIYLDSADSMVPHFTHTIDMPTTALHGMRTTKELAEIFSSSYKAFNGVSPFMRYLVNPAIARPKGWAQRAATEWNLMTHARNLGGSATMHVANGWFGGKFWDSFQETYQGLKQLPKKEFDDLIQYYGNLGVINTSVRAGQIRQLLTDDIYNIKFKDVDSWLHHAAIDKPRKLGKMIVKGVGDVYQGEDNLFKIMAFKKERDYLKSVYGNEKSVLEIDHMAANIVKNTMPNYAYIPRSLRALRYVPFGNFFSFRYEEIRTGFNIFSQAIEELQDPRRRMRGVRRLGGFMGAVAIGGSGVSSGYNWIQNISREEEAAVRQVVPEWSKGGNLTISRDEYGRITSYTDISNNSPYDIYQRYLPVIFKNITEGKLQDESMGKIMRDIAWEISMDFGRPFAQEDIHGKNIIDIILRKGRDAEGKEIFRGRFEDNPIENTWASIQHVLKSFIPGSYKSFERIYKGFEGTPDDFGRYYDPWVELAGAFFGVKNNKVDMNITLDINATDFIRDLSSANTIFSDELVAQAPLEEIVEGYEKADDTRVKAFKRLALVVNAAQTLGLRDTRIEEVLKDKGVGKADISAILMNRYRYLPVTNARIEMIENRSRMGMPGEIQEITRLLQNAQMRNANIRLLAKDDEEENKFESGISRGYAKGGVVDIPRVAPEPDERQDPLLGQPYNETAGAAFQDAEDREEWL